MAAGIPQADDPKEKAREEAFVSSVTYSYATVSMIYTSGGRELGYIFWREGC